MANYPGATQNALETNFLGGLNTRSTLLNIGPGQAADIQNFDLANDGSLASRGGYVELATLGTPMRWFGKYYRTDTGNVGTARWVAVAGGKIWDAATPAGPWTDISGSVSFWDTTKPVIGASFRGRLILTNGVDKPVYIFPGQNAVTLEDATLIPAPNSANAVPQTLAQTSYAVTAFTPRGETKCVLTSVLCNVPTAASPITISWAPVTGAIGYRIYQLVIAGQRRQIPDASQDGNFLKIADVGSTTLSYADAYLNFPTDSYGNYTPVPSSSTAYNTPSDWNINGQPDLCAVVAEGREERLYMARKDTIWSSALANPLDWFNTRDAFVFTLVGGRDRTITAIGATFDYTLISSSDTTWVYSGVGPTTISCQKIIPVGISSHGSIARFGTDLFFWSQYGPTSLARILAGADLEANTDMDVAVNPTVYASPTALWTGITAHVDTPNNRICWWYPKGASSTGNDAALVFQCNAKAFTTYQNLSVIRAETDAAFLQYLALSNGKIVKFQSGDLDNATPIACVYKSRWYDMGTWARRKRIIWFDVVMDKTESYSLSCAWSTDYGKFTATPIVLTPTTTDGATIESTGPTLQLHRVFANGYGNGFQVQFTGSTSAGGGIKIVGLRPDTRIKGTRR